MQSNHAIYNWLSIMGIGCVRWQNLKKQWQALQITEAEAWLEVLKNTQTFLLPDKIKNSVKKHHTRFGNDGWLDFLHRHHIAPTTVEEKTYPSKVKNLLHPPPVLYIQTKVAQQSDVLDKPMLAVVGTRHPTPSGEQVLKSILAHFLQSADNKVVIASGMMYGIDELAHRQALLEGSPTLAVLGAGLIWQKQHDRTSLFQAILENEGVLVSQFHPEISPSKGTFVTRNTTLAGLSDAVLVGEAHVGSGSRHTVAAAARLSKPVWTVPVHSAHATAPAVVDLVNTYSAKLLINDQPLRAFFGIQNNLTPVNTLSNTTATDPTAAQLLFALQEGSMTFERLSQKVVSNPSQITEMLVRLELAGTIERRGPEWLLVDMK